MMGPAVDRRNEIKLEFQALHEQAEANPRMDYVDNFHEIASRHLEIGNRAYLVNVLKGWIDDASPDFCHLSLLIAARNGLRELRDPIEELRTKVDSGNTFDPSYLETIDSVLADMETAAEG